MNMNLEGITIPVICGLVYLLITAIKRMTKNETILSMLPIIAVSAGALLGVAIFFTAPQEIILSSNAWSAALVGGASGLAATGTNQIFKQLGKLSLGNSTPESDAASENENDVQKDDTAEDSSDNKSQ